MLGDSDVDAIPWENGCYRSNTDDNAPIPFFLLLHCSVWRNRSGFVLEGARPEIYEWPDNPHRCSFLLAVFVFIIIFSCRSRFYRK